MMHTHPTAEEFLTSPVHAEEDEGLSPAADPLVSIAESLQILASAAVQGQPSAHDPGPSPTVLDEIEMRALNAEAARDDMEAQMYEAHGKLEEIAALVKPSASKLANAIRAVLAPPTPEVDEEDEPHAFFSEDGVDSCRLCGRHAADGQGIHVTDEQPRELPEGVYVSPTSDAAVTVNGGPGQQPAHDAPVEEWRTYARHLGHGRTGPAFNELEAMNRSQIRSMLGILQPVTRQ